MLRSEFKYFIPNQYLEEVRSFISPYMELDKFARRRKNGQYTVRSIYFDTQDFYCHWSKIEGLKHRYKIRVRGYNQPKPENILFLEIKKKFEQPILKFRSPFRWKNMEALFRGAPLEDMIISHQKFPDALDNARRFFFHVYSKNMRPVNCVIYEREAYESRFPDPQNNLRVTLDKNLRTTAYPSMLDLYQEEDLAYVLKDHFIMEVKFNRSRPAWVKPLINMLNLIREPASKYCMGIDAHPRINPRAGLDVFSYGKILRS